MKQSLALFLALGMCSIQVCLGMENEKMETEAAKNPSTDIRTKFTSGMLALINSFANREDIEYQLRIEKLRVSSFHWESQPSSQNFRKRKMIDEEVDELAEDFAKIKTGDDGETPERKEGPRKRRK